MFYSSGVFDLPVSIEKFSSEPLWQFHLLNYRLHTLISIGMTYAGIAVIIMGMQQMSSLNMI